MLVSLIGAAVIVVVMGDFLATTIGATAYSPLSKHVARGAFRLVRLAPRSHMKHRVSGVAVMTAIAVWWIAGIATGWTLVFAGTGTGVVDADTGQAAPLTGIASHVGHLLSTVGGGVTKPNGTGWSLLGVLVGVNGMVVLTLSVSFVLSTTQTVARGRAFLMKMEHAASSSVDAERFIHSELVDLVAMLNAAPFALYYSTVRENRRLPSGLTRLIAADGSVDPSTNTDILAELPWLKLEDATSTQRALETWADQFVV